MSDPYHQQGDLRNPRAPKGQDVVNPAQALKTSTPVCRPSTQRTTALSPLCRSSPNGSVSHRSTSQASSVRASFPGVKLSRIYFVNLDDAEAYVHSPKNKGGRGRITFRSHGSAYQNHRIA